MDSNGQYPDICMNNRGWVIQVYHKETVLGLNLRYKIGHLRNQSIAWSNHHSFFSKGFYPRVDLNDKDTVVSVFASQVGRQLFIRLGRLKKEDYGSAMENSNSSSALQVSSSEDTSSHGAGSLQRGSSTPQGSIGSSSTSSNPLPAASPAGFGSVPRLSDEDGQPLPDQGVINGANIRWERKQQFGEGRNPAVSLNNNNVVVVVYEKGVVNPTTYYRIGDCHVKDGKISWRTEGTALFGPGRNLKHASVSLNDSDQVVVGYSSGMERAVHYAAGTISDESNTLVLGDETCTPAGVNYQPTVSLNNHGHVLAVHHTLRGRLYLKVNYGLWSAGDGPGGQPKVDWAMRNPSNFAIDGHHASVVVSDRMKVVTAYKSLTLHFDRSIRNRVGQLHFVNPPH